MFQPIKSIIYPIKIQYANRLKYLMPAALFELLVTREKQSKFAYTVPRTVKEG